LKEPKAIRTCKRWDDDNQYLIDNYLTETNEELADALGRNPDAVRKQLNNIGLKRPLKSETKKIENKAKAPDFFTMLNKGQKKKNEVLQKEEKKRRDNIRKEEEKKWANNFLHEEKVVVFKPKGPQISLQIDYKTVIFVDSNTTPEERKKIVENFIKKRGY